ncbi:FG-GAP repeat domain-containing protein [Halomontanus rarus]|uniref:FG-GAP repeat domain-containing protein n=1 Tax=Halomontanus rarus TaxID=3034020 RepID=UPI0023E77F02|nr:VCBS repeat-containing protein [Halovivax sp. TS33]
MEFRHERLDEDAPCTRQMLCLPTDLTGNGLPDVLVGGNEDEPRVYWYENPGWERHEIATGTPIMPGAALGDITGNGRLDLISGGPWDHHDTYWFEQPADPRDPWTKHVICNDYNKYHDQAFADVDDDGEPEVVFVSQNAEVVFYYDIPDDPRGSGWPRKNRQIVDAGVGDAEGIQVLDVDGDGRTELVVGRRIFHRKDEDGTEWEAERVAPDWEDERVRVVAADIDDDGEVELLLAECELPSLGARHDIYHDGRLGLCSEPDWEPTVLRDDLHCPHSLQVADFDGDGSLDIYVAESDYGEHDNPRHFVFENLGDGEFETHLVHEGTPTHQAKAVDLTGDGRPDIVGKDDTDNGRVDVWYNEN